MEIKQEKVQINIDNNIANDNNNNRLLKICISIFNIFLILDDINLHISSLPFKFYFLQLLLAEIIIFYLWLILRNNKIILMKTNISIICGIYSFISLIFLIFQFMFQDFNLTIKNLFLVVFIHQIIHILFPMSIIIFLFYF